jgi:hypothetical protein
MVIAIPHHLANMQVAQANALPQVWDSSYVEFVPCLFLPRSMCRARHFPFVGRLKDRQGALGISL